ncbi:MAG: hypothetical protein ABEI98_06170 [Halorhabdus sp.]
MSGGPRNGVPEQRPTERAEAVELVFRVVERRHSATPRRATASDLAAAEGVPDIEAVERLRSDVTRLALAAGSGLHPIDRGSG